MHYGSPEALAARNIMHLWSFSALVVNNMCLPSMVFRGKENGLPKFETHFSSTWE